MDRKPESPRQREAFMIYFNLGKDRSIENVRQEIAKVAPENSVSLRSLKLWSAKFGWVERVQEMDREVFEKAEVIAIKEATIEKSKIIQFVKNVFIRANKGIVDGTMMPSVSDVKKAWEIMRTELGQEIPREEEVPQVNIFLTKNQNILNIVHKASEELKQALMDSTMEDMNEKP